MEAGSSARTGLSKMQADKCALLVLPDRLALLDNGAQAFLHVFQAHEFVEVEVLLGLHCLLQWQANGVSDHALGYLQHGTAEF